MTDREPALKSAQSTSAPSPDEARPGSASEVVATNQTQIQPAVANPAVVLGEIRPGDPGVWQPQSFTEWEATERTKTFLAAWSAQVADERRLRRGYARWIFSLITLQVLGLLVILVLQGRGVLSIQVDLLKIVLPSILGEVVGLGFLVTKYLFSQPLRASLDSLAMGARAPSTPTTKA